MYILDPNLGWNSGGRSRQVCFDDCQCTFSVPVGVSGVAVALNAGEYLGPGFRELSHALVFTTAEGIYLCTVYESGVSKGVSTTYVATDVFTIRRVNDVVTYHKNGTLLYTSVVPLAGAVFMDSCLYAAGDSIT